MKQDNSPPATGSGGLQGRKLPKNKISKAVRSQDKSKPKTTWEKRMADRKRLEGVRALSRQLRSEIKAEEESARQARKANRERRAENERKNTVVSEIKNIRKIKKLSPKQRRKARIVLKNEM